MRVLNETVNTLGREAIAKLRDVKALPGAKAEKRVRMKGQLKTDASETGKEVTEITLKEDAA